MFCLKPLVMGEIQHDRLFLLPRWWARCDFILGQLQWKGARAEHASVELKEALALTCMAAPLQHSIAVIGKRCAIYSAMLVGPNNRDLETRITSQVGVGKRTCVGRMDTRTRNPC